MILKAVHREMVFHPKRPGNVLFQSNWKTPTTIKKTAISRGIMTRAPFMMECVFCRPSRRPDPTHFKHSSLLHRRNVRSAAGRAPRCIDSLNYIVFQEVVISKKLQFPQITSTAPAPVPKPGENPFSARRRSRVFPGQRSPSRRSCRRWLPALSERPEPALRFPGPWHPCAR